MAVLGIALYGDNAKDLAEAFGAIESSGLDGVKVYYQPTSDDPTLGETFDALQSHSAVPNTWTRLEFEPIRKSAAIENALFWASSMVPEATHYLVLSTDVRLPPFWFTEMSRVLEAKTVRNEAGEFQSPRIQFVGPVSDGIALPAQHLDLEQADIKLGVTGYAMRRASHVSGVAGHADTLDPCMVLWRAEDTDKMILALVNGWDAAMRSGVCAVAEGCYIGRTKPERVGAWQPGDDWQRIFSCSRYVQQRGIQKLFAVVTVTLDTARSMDLLKATIASCAGKVDGFSICFDGDPTAALDDAKATRTTLAPQDEKALKKCVGMLPAQMASVLQGWATELVRGLHKEPTEIVVNVYGGSDLTAGRTRAYEAAGRLGAKWLLLIEPDEMLDGSVTPAYIARLVNHPDPQVLGYDCGLLTHYNSLHQVRADGPRGTNMEKGPSGVRLVRYIEGRTRPAISANGHGVTISPLLSEESVRAANIRIRKLDMLRPEDRLHVQESSESIAVYAYHNETRIGFHCLCYNRENLDDMGRWLDIATGLCDESVVVWTDETAPSAEWSVLFGLYGVKVVHHPLADDLAAARNAGLDALSDKLTWAWFVDPDEWFAQPLKDAKAIRRMAESVRYGYLFQTCNYRGDKPPSISDSVRMSRLERSIRMNGRVHEGFGDAWKRLQAQGIHPRLVYAPFIVQHRGMSFSPERMREKLDKYERLLRLELADRPENPGAWVSLAWHFFNDGAMDEGHECLRRGVACGGTSYLPYREMAYWHLRQAQAMLDQSIERLSEGHQWYQAASDLRRALLQHVEPMHSIDRDTTRAIAPLPKFRDSD